MPLSPPSLTYLKRVMEILISHNEIGVTNLAMKTRINHQRCNTVLQSLESAGFVISKFDGGNKRFVTLTNAGAKYGTKLMEVDFGSYQTT